jgi:hypothetical protein
MIMANYADTHSEIKQKEDKSKLDSCNSLTEEHMDE